MKSIKKICAFFLIAHQGTYPLATRETLAAEKEALSFEREEKTTDLSQKISKSLGTTIVEEDNNTVHIYQPNQKKIIGQNKKKKVETHLEELSYRLVSLEKTPETKDGNQTNHEFGKMLKGLAGTILYAEDHSSKGEHE